MGNIVEETDNMSRLEELEGYAESLNILNKVGQLYNQTEQYEEVFKITAKYTPTIIKTALRASIVLVNEGGETYSVFALEGNDAIPIGAKVPLENTGIEACIQANELINESDARSKSYTDYQMLSSNGMCCIMNVPLVDGGKVLGTLNVAGKSKFNWRDEKLLTKIASLLASTLSSRLLFSKLQKALSQIQKSINYAQRIQTAVLPSDEEIKDILPKSFIFYEPRDVVSGDFYWYTKLDNKIFFAVGDCTGHGVPGCLMTMLGYNTLNQIVRELRFGDPSLILCELDSRIRHILRQNDKDNRIHDGMDIIFCVIDTDTNKLTFAGAKRSLIMIRDGELHEFKGDKNPIGGGYYKSKNFTLQTIDLREDDSFYLFTDGITDQFGGDVHRKYTSRKLKGFIQSIQSRSMDTQGIYIENEFLKWKSSYPQTDDVLIVGFKPVFN